ncbi:MAG: NAD(P)/FAD-dependent oxidoreductase [Deltaproteobacteria bacterium]
MESGNEKLHRVVILGGGFGGLYAAKELSRLNFRVTLIDKRNFHLFQPLLYQVAAGWLSPGEIASPLRMMLNRYKNTYVFKGEVIDILPREKKVLLRDDEVEYDTLIVATGSHHHYFGHDEWAETAPGLKTVEDALEMRRKILLSFEAAERETDPEIQKEWMTFLIIGAGPTGVELAGTIGELTRTTLKHDFRNINTADSKIILVEGLDHVLPTYPPELSVKAEESLKCLGVTIRLNTMVTEIKGNKVKIKKNGEEEEIQSRTILWTAGVKASFLGKVIEQRAGAVLDKGGRVIVESDLSVPGHPDIFVIGDLAHFSGKDGEPLPGVAPVAMQEGRYVARLIEDRRNGKEPGPFKYVDKGSLAVIGRNSAVAEIGKFKLSGFLAWIIWAFVHIRYLIEFDNKIVVLFRWAWNYFTRKRGVRLITGDTPATLIENKKKKLSG